MPFVKMAVIHIEDSFIDEETCFKLKTFASNSHWREYNDKFWSGRVLSFNDTHESLMSVTNNIKQKISDYIQIKYGSKAYCDTIDFVRWEDGREMPPHRDAMDAYTYRDWGSVLYLNSDYMGGHTYYPELNFDVKPKIGSLVVHAGDVLHGVKPIFGNTRYTIASFWTRDKTQAVYDRIHK